MYLKWHSCNKALWKIFICTEQVTWQKDKKPHEEFHTFCPSWSTLGPHIGEAEIQRIRGSKLQQENLKLWDYLEDLELDGKILKLMLKKRALMWAGLIWLKPKALTGICARNFGFCGNIKQLSVSQEGLFLMSVSSIARGFSVKTSIPRCQCITFHFRDILKSRLDYHSEPYFIQKHKRNATRNCCISSPIWMKPKQDLHKMLLNKCEFHENWCCKSHSSYNDVNTIQSPFSTFFRFGWISVQRCPQNFREIAFFLKIGAVKVI